MRGAWLLPARQEITDVRRLHCHTLIYFVAKEITKLKLELQRIHPPECAPWMQRRQDLHDRI